MLEMVIPGAAGVVCMYVLYEWVGLEPLFPISLSESARGLERETGCCRKRKERLLSWRDYQASVTRLMVQSGFRSKRKRKEKKKWVVLFEKECSGEEEEKQITKGTRVKECCRALPSPETKTPKTQPSFPHKAIPTRHPPYPRSLRST